ncbi:hypothetical protein [Clostridium haemolyticum]|uniref:Uncharacterized protein n=1 Tax=Clostridium haemolyticum NCTC 9693 TaxID=1443114 RepID=A0ABR4TBG3_CLOHA|nr:hypothetical protein [Clostridium haemolyticum]KEI14442.1 hypothetical protein Z960_12370 [Clostridium haemolyticum NCTC 9693]KGM98694.1 hypothetical protein Z961_12390 [Clostridium haemolyticum NCTC 8350]
MIKKSMYYFYFNKFITPLKFVRFKNIGDFTIKCIVQYTVNSSTFTKIVILSKNRIRKIELPVDAIDICLNILNLSNPDPITSVLYHECISGQENICFEISNTTESPVINRTIC